ncbi:hypothetical protein MRB53_038609 [Persea americana]|nr:hypothetical protein MRB53_038609 [Persea americana]
MAPLQTRASPSSAATSRAPLRKMPTNRPFAPTPHPARSKNPLKTAMRRVLGPHPAGVHEARRGPAEPEKHAPKQKHSLGLRDNMSTIEALRATTRPANPMIMADRRTTYSGPHTGLRHNGPSFPAHDPRTKHNQHAVSPLKPVHPVVAEFDAQTEAHLVQLSDLLMERLTAEYDKLEESVNTVSLQSKQYVQAHADNLTLLDPLGDAVLMYKRAIQDPKTGTTKHEEKSRRLSEAMDEFSQATTKAEGELAALWQQHDELEGKIKACIQNGWEDEETILEEWKQADQEVVDGLKSTMDKLVEEMGDTMASQKRNRQEIQEMLLMCISALSGPTSSQSQPADVDGGVLVAETSHKSDGDDGQALESKLWL